METKEMICIGCPLGCELKVTIDNDEITVSGNNCPNGEKYAKNEIRDPKRIVTSTVLVLDGKEKRVSCKTGQVPKNKIFECMDIIKKTSVKAPIKIGDVLVQNIADTGVDLVATKNIDKGE